MTQPSHQPADRLPEPGKIHPPLAETSETPPAVEGPPTRAPRPAAGDLPRDLPGWGLALIGAWVTGIVLWGLSSFGIWDPWELTAADAARGLPGGQELAARTPPLPRLLVGAGFSLFGVREWAGRLPIALAGLLALGLGYAMVSRFAGRRAGAFTVLVAGTTPLFLFNARQMIGDAPTFAVDALVGGAALAAIYRPTLDRSSPRAVAATAGWLATLAFGLVLSYFARGVLLGGLPAVLAVALTACFRGDLGSSSTDRRRTWAARSVTFLAAVSLLGVLLAVLGDAAQYSGWLGGMPRGGEPPTFEITFERIFHTFAPWSALLLLAFGRLVVGSTETTPEDGATAPLRIALLLWAALAYGALTLFSSRYGTAPYPALIPLAAAVALLLVDLERSPRPLVAGAIVAGLFVLLLIRDFSLYPASPLSSLAAPGLELPAEFNPRRTWRALFAAFAGFLVLGFAVTPGAGARAVDFRAPYRGLVASWRKGGPTRAWLVVAALVLATLLVFGLVSLVFGTRAGLTSIAVRTGRRLALLVPAIPMAIAGSQVVFWLVARLGSRRLLPLLAVGGLIGAYTAQIHTPAASALFSPREVFDLLRRHAGAGEALGEYRTGSRAAEYYADRPIEALKTPAAVATFLSSTTRAWVLVPADELATVNKAHRDKTRRHLFVLGAEESRILLATNRPLPNVADQNPLASAVRGEVPAVQHRVGARFENKLELVGYDLDLPEQGYAGAGQTFTITWVYRVLDRISGNYKPFVHIDRGSQRIHGDHEPVDGKYPVRLWSPSDVIVDRQTVAIPANMRPGTYEIFTGFFSGETRLKVVEGRNDGSDRVRAGTIEVR